MIRRALADAAALLLTLSGVASAETARKTPSPDVSAEKFYKNIQVFQTLPSTELMPAMKFMADALGVKCSYCHVTNDTGRWPVDRDDKAAKGRAREMIRMTREINRANFKGRVEVTCATCHHGAVKPASMPPIASESAVAHTAPPSVSGAAEPPVDAVLEKYIAAAGGKEAIARIGSRQIRGTFMEDGQSHPIEIIQTVGGKYRSSVTLEVGALTMIFDGKSGWTIGPSWKNPMQPDEIERIRTHAALFPAANLKARFPALALRGREEVDGRSAWIMRARPAEGSEEVFCFDAENGLLLRTIARLRTPLGDIPEQTDYADYREVDGARVPFVIRHTAPDRTDTITVSEIRHNVDLDDASFAPPK